MQWMTRMCAALSALQSTCTPSLTSPYNVHEPDFNTRLYRAEARIYFMLQPLKHV